MDSVVGPQTAYDPPGDETCHLHYCITLPGVLDYDDIVFVASSGVSAERDMKGPSGVFDRDHFSVNRRPI